MFILGSYRLGKQKWVPLPLDSSGTDPAQQPDTATKPSPGKGNRPSRNARPARDAQRNRTRSLDGYVPKRNRKNRGNNAPPAPPAQVPYNAYQDYSYYYYDPSVTPSRWHSDKQGKRKKKTQVDNASGPAAAPATVEAKESNTTDAPAPISDVHKFIFDDETVVVDDCSFVLPYIEGAFYYPSTASPSDNEFPQTMVHVNPENYVLPNVPAYSEPQLKELLRRQV